MVVVVVVVVVKEGFGEQVSGRKGFSHQSEEVCGCVCVWVVVDSEFRVFQRLDGSKE